MNLIRMKNAASSRRSLSQIEGQLSHGQPHCNGSSIDSPLKLFSKAKNKINKIFQEIGVYLGEASSFLQEKCFVSEKLANEIDKYSEEVKTYLEQVAGIAKVLRRDSMKVAFFGRTSNGKSTVINALLRDRILPSGIGHTTSCFFSVNGTEVETPYVLTPGSDEKKNIQSLSQLAHELCQEKLDPSSLIQVNWPRAKCALLRNDIVLLDSPGIDVSPDLDSWIDNYCLDADVFVLVANSESTLMVTEKKFFNKVNQKLSRPNIFILNNRWDASAFEPEFMMAVKNQHMERTVGFLVNELKCIDQCEAENRVFFVSAKEVLTKRMQENQGMRDTGAAIHAEGFQERLMEFEHFERKFEECISKSAIQTKFESHVVQGMQTTKFVREIMEKIEAKSKVERQKCIEAKCSWEERLAIMKDKLDVISHEFKNKIKEIKEEVELQVATAMNDEIKRLGILVNQFDHPFHAHSTVIEIYKRDLVTHIANGLGRNLTARCGLALSQSIDETKQSMTDQLASLLPPEDRHEVMTMSDSRHEFEVSYQLDIPNICSDFKEDLEFHFSHWLQTMLRKLWGPSTSRSGQSRSSTELDEGETTASRSDEVLKDHELTLAVIRNIASLTSHSATGIVVVGGLVWNNVGWKLIVGCGGLYGSLYIIGGSQWTNYAKEKAFKNQFVEYMANRRQSVVSMTSSNCSQQVMSELSSTFVQLCYKVDAAKKKVENEISKLSEDITELEDIESQAHLFGNKARRLEDQLKNFIQEFGLL
ncbi:mitofusin-2-like [Xenia sp. Carnegie-2017]|uniref:mitofusin-2-like n=1 Tax=Xenia sp. Carnegie-2017 TaxID=2897299 RepID=UPI001F04F9DF|nr:mitofusin-2-like [Xenia sp. Carnegie-2017]XP_046850406.1 mitofusin-2-like [Xenia sp. Carnegie-2017]